jgi:UDP-N-acetylmuramoyl-L-alanyl-D-glutamate--2,6-diaminopimelate ligase
MTILKLLKGLHIDWKRGPLDGAIKGVAYDSRLVKKDYLFVAVKGFSVDGHDYIKDAVNRGATMIVAEHPVEITDSRQSDSKKEATCISVPDSREALALISAAFYRHPSKRLSLIGITGTNGKTTTSFITKSIIDAGAGKAGLLGTICYMTGDKTTAAVNTTPESLDLQRYLSEMLDNNIEHAIMEVSSHALALKRVEGCSFRVAAFTNFSQDHLDFHSTMDEYFNAKGKLFHYLDSDGTAVLNWDDERIRKLAKKLDRNVITCGFNPGAMIRAENVKESGMENLNTGRLYFDVQTPESQFRIDSKLIGRFNAYNILMSIGIAYASGIKEDVIRRGISEAQPVAGRFEHIDEGQQFLCIIDYAHTEDALRKLIEEARYITPGRVITVFGCGGDRDRTKRSLMGHTASELSDFIVITSDNPRSEAPSAIITDIVNGVRTHNYTSQPDREEAIKEALSMAKGGDTVLIAGKGHENYQEVNGVRQHFSDKEIVKKEIRKLLALSS